MEKILEENHVNLQNQINANSDTENIPMDIDDKRMKALMIKAWKALMIKIRLRSILKIIPRNC